MHLLAGLFCVVFAGLCPVASAETGASAEQDSQAIEAFYEISTTGPITATQVGDGVWWTPEFNTTSVTETLDYLVQAEVPNIYIDVFSEGMTAFPSQIFPSRSNSTTTDGLNDFIAEAHRRNIRVHAWLQVLQWENYQHNSTTHPLFVSHPHWMEVSLEGSAADEKTSSVFASPGVPAVRDALNGLVEEICAFPFDGLCFDSMHYNPYEETGYNLETRQGFRLDKGLEPANITPATGRASEWMQWVTYREDVLTSLATKLCDTVRRSEATDNGRTIISFTVRPDYEENRGSDTSYQNWKDWLDLALPDVTIPQCFSPQLPGLEQQLWAARSTQVGSRVASIPGLALTSGSAELHPSLADQKRMLRGAGFQHFTLLDFAAFKQARENTQPEKETKGFWEIFRPGD